MKNRFKLSTRLQRVFAENLAIGNKRLSRFQEEEETPNRAVLIFVMCLVFFMFGVARLFDLQLIRGEYFHSLAQGNRLRQIPIKAARGEILDRNGIVLARNIPRYNLAKFSSGGVITELREINRDDALRIQSDDSFESGNSLIVDVSREYPSGAAISHVLGYVNQANEDEVGNEINCPDGQKNPYTRLYEIGDLVGRGGIEEKYECLLRGVNGADLVEVDSRGRIIRSLGRREPVPGKSIKLSIDSALQLTAYNSLLNAPTEIDQDSKKDIGTILKGAVVATDPQNGEIIALVSLPSFDPALISKQYQEFANDENKPLFNRSIAGVYPPGSTYKIVTSAAGIEEGVINSKWTFKDEGFISVGPYYYRNWYFTQYGKTEGEINVVKALARSTDTFYYKVGEMVGVDNLGKWSNVFGYGQKTGVDLLGEVSGVIPNEEWKIKLKGERWYLGNTYHMSIGQGDILSTPLQVNMATSLIASGGQKCKPHLLKEVLENGQWRAIEYLCENIHLKKETTDSIKEGMVGACSEGGTAYSLFKFDPKVACKTGTAQFSGDKPHSWLTSFTPALNPVIVITALVEGGGEGSRVAAPVVKSILEQKFQSKNDSGKLY